MSTGAPLPFKNAQEIEKLKAIQELEVTLENNWEKYYGCQVFKENNIVHLQLCVRNRYSNKNINITSTDIDHLH